MPPAARFSDKVLHDNPHCHAPIHPAGPVPTPMPHPPIPIDIVLKCVPTVLIDNLQAAVVTSMTKPCMMPSCVPGGPGMIVKGSTTVLIGMMPAARMGDLVAFTTCIGPIPGPTGKIIPPCSTTVMIGG